MSTKDLPVDRKPLGIALIPGAVMQLPPLRLREDVGVEPESASTGSPPPLPLGMSRRS